MVDAFLTASECGEFLGRASRFPAGFLLGWRWAIFTVLEFAQQEIGLARPGDISRR
jgi:hypothetical protein